VGAQGIAAEILFCRRAAKKIAADSPVFCGAAAKNAPKFRIINEILNGLLDAAFEVH
jgi:hypothetical protein